MKAAEQTFWQSQDIDDAAAHSLVERASERSCMIRQRLAVVAQELRQAAATGDSRSEGLLALAQKFEHHSKSGDNA